MADRLHRRRPLLPRGGRGPGDVARPLHARAEAAAEDGGDELVVQVLGQLLLGLLFLVRSE